MNPSAVSQLPQACAPFTGGSWNPSHTLPAAFLELPAQLYASDPFWLGENAINVHQQFSVKNRWFDQGQAWIGVIPGQARLAGFRLTGQQVDGEQAAFFGFWESIDDPEPNQQLFAALRHWAQAEGATRLYGPINFSTFGANRVRLDAFDHGAFPGEPWNPPYYADLLAQCGLSQRYGYVSTFSDLKATLPAIRSDYARFEPTIRAHLRIETLSPDFWMAHLPELYAFVDEVFGSNFAYTPISFETFVAACGRAYAERFCPHSSVIALDPEGRIAGFFLVFPDYSPLMRVNGPTPVAASELRFAQHAPLLPAPRRALAKTGGVRPDCRASGLFTAMSCELSIRAAEHYDEIVAALVREDNPSLKFAARHGLLRQHHYGLFELALSAQVP